VATARAPFPLGVWSSARLGRNRKIGEIDDMILREHRRPSSCKYISSSPYSSADSAPPPPPPSRAAMATIVAAAASPFRLQLGRSFPSPFICRRCLLQSRAFRSKALHSRQSLRDNPFLSAFRSPPPPIRSKSSSSSPPSPAPAPPSPSTTPLGALSQSITGRPVPKRDSSATPPSVWPAVSSRSVAYWLLASAASVFGLVVFGGLTRLTESGLSITEWRPVTGSLPPRDAEAWEDEFARYRQSPEFKLLNSRMTLDEFKQIYWMEWTHRLWGRVVGVTFLLPALWFIARRRVTRRMAGRLAGIGGLIGFQGFIGWWMVKSGLKDDLLSTPNSHPRVSQYRLAVHLGTAFTVYLAMVWHGLEILRERRLLADPARGIQDLSHLRHPNFLPFRRAIVALAALTFLTAMSGALVAGLDAGLIYNDFPWMGGTLIPPRSELLDPAYSRGSAGDTIWRNMCENPVLAQLDHRVLAITTFTAVWALWGYTRFHPLAKRLPAPAHRGVHGLVGLASMQAALGIATLWYLVPTPLAAAHQAGALALLTGVWVLGGRVWVPRRLWALMRGAMAERQGGLAMKMGERKIGK